MFPCPLGKWKAKKVAEEEAAVVEEEAEVCLRVWRESLRSLWCL